jgi:hypothetical protein
MRKLLRSSSDDQEVAWRRPRCSLNGNETRRAQLIEHSFRHNAVTIAVVPSARWRAYAARRGEVDDGKSAARTERPKQGRIHDAHIADVMINVPHEDRFATAVRKIRPGRSPFDDDDVAERRGGRRLPQVFEPLRIDIGRVETPGRPEMPRDRDREHTAARAHIRHRGTGLQIQHFNQPRRIGDVVRVLREGRPTVRKDENNYREARDSSRSSARHAS